ncbi:hypothetical protein CC86DRAFT_409961 [Ophiobolus disseminans]|uniref:DUF7730 domain-containing protein n=1 Tax=Ophiobolus disseminans TaxID=1469910 RepID=A0A6A6ZN88_9PLEO|nr:hypothetical protein CC86DRAFT_409961 [Ophiobolus disseminans]
MTSVEVGDPGLDAAIRKARERRRRRRKVLYVTMTPIIPILLLLSAPWILFEMHRSTDAYKEKKRRKEEAKDAKPPKLKQRKRALSISQDLPQSTIVKHQLQSRLCTLPAELRLQIYGEIFGKREGIHVEFHQGVIHADRCRVPHDEAMAAQLHAQCRCRSQNQGRQPIPFRGKNVSNMGVLGLLQSCRQMYTEFITLLYSQPTFLFHDYHSLIAFFSAILPERFNSIQSIILWQDPELTPLEQPKVALFSGVQSYRILHVHKCKMRNPILPTLPPLNRAYKDNDVWFQVRNILRQMPALKEMRVQISISLLGIEARALRYGEDPPRVGQLRTLVHNLWEDPTTKEWEDFEFSTNVYATTDYWHIIKGLRKKG